MKFNPTACWRMRTSPAPGAASSMGSYTSASGPPTLCTRTAFVIRPSPSGANQRTRNQGHRSLVVNSTPSNRLTRLLFAVALRQHVEELDRYRERDRKVDVAPRNVELESVGNQRHADQDQEGE